MIKIKDVTMDREWLDDHAWWNDPDGVKAFAKNIKAISRDPQAFFAVLYKGVRKWRRMSARLSQKVLIDTNGKPGNFMVVNTGNS